jgi:hypothetical protein
MRLSLCNGNHAVDLWDIASFSVCNCELSITFTNDQHYLSINDICAVLKEVGIPVGNFFFKGLSSWDFTEDNWGKLIPKREYTGSETAILCMIPENIRDSFTATAVDTNATSELPY